MAIEMKVVGLDVAKNVFQVHGADRRGETVLRKRLRRLTTYFSLTYSSFVCFRFGVSGSASFHKTRKLL
jgi:hypothetical protein